VHSAFFEPAGPDAFLATPATAGPWSAQAQHGGPPSALVARAFERHEPTESQRLARVTVDILQPVPVGKVSVRTRMVRPGPATLEDGTVVDLLDYAAGHQDDLVLKPSLRYSGKDVLPGWHAG